VLKPGYLLLTTSLLATHNPMRQQSREYIVILFIGAVLAINYPVLELFNRSWALFGIPLLYFYLYLVWLVLIIGLIAVVERSEIHESEEPPKPGATEWDRAPGTRDATHPPPSEQP